MKKSSLCFSPSLFGLVMLLLGLATSSCNDPLSLFHDASGKSRVTLVLSGSGARTLAPVLTPVSYSVTVSGGPTSMDVIDSRTPTVSVELEGGTYTFQATGYDAQRNPVCTGSTQVSISGQSQTVPLSMTPKFLALGHGNLDLAIHVPATAVADSITLSIVPQAQDSTEQPVNQTFTGNNPVFQKYLAAGSYVLGVDVYRGTRRIGGTQESLIIAPDLTTTARLELDARDVELLRGVEGGMNNSFLIKADGTLWACGFEWTGQLGLGDVVPGPGFNQVGSRKNWIMVSAGNSTLGIQGDGSLWAWGANGYGDLGDGTTTTRYFPERIGTDIDWESVSTSNRNVYSGYFKSHTLSLKRNGTLWAWGNNAVGQLGNGTTDTSLVPVQIGTDTDWVQVYAGYGWSAALKSNGSLHAWGTGFTSTPTAIAEGYAWKYLSGTVAIRTDGTLWYWNGASPSQISATTDWVAVDTGISCLAMKNDGSLWSWGDNGYGQLGDGTYTSQSTPRQIGSTKTWVAFGAGSMHSLAVGSDGKLMGWGWDDVGQLGDSGQKNTVLTPHQFAGTDWAQISSCNKESHGLKSDGSLWSLGNWGTAQIGTDTDWKTVKTGKDWAIALKDNGTLWTWGTLLGVTNATPVQIGTAADWASIDLNEDVAAARKTDGTLWCWGSNQYGELGDGTRYSSQNPKKIGTGTNWAAVSRGSHSTLAIKTDGSLWAWGDNSTGQLGDGSKTDRLSPVRIGTATDWAAVGAGDFASLALKTNGSLWRLNSTVTQIGTDYDWQSIGVGDSHCLALKSDGSLWAWGMNWSGELGDGTTLEVSSPKRIGTASNWQEISSGDSISRGIQADGSLWVWGDNLNGILGLDINTASMNLIDFSIY